ncbi:nucleotide exchange factor GrpE [Dysosmobacter sp. HCP28S3_G4]|uniref:nucleotide exchange factor GrpE n=1 Tax=Dysosmobacter sp. HCP28S3_G4 TaxID=3438938 RepID=UPI003F8C5C18|nr:nucleotide exchange factor GrpE [Dysosmobacter sp.]
MSDETKQPTPEEEQGRQAPETEETAPRQEPETAGEGGAKPEEPREEKASDKRKKDKDAKKKEKEKTYTLTREQMEAAELAAKQLETVKDQYTRLAAEYDNYRKRTAKEKESIYQDAKIDTIQEFLAVYDNLERAVAAEGGDDSPHKKGMEMIFVQYKKILEKLGVTEIEAKGQPFDPNRHNAVMHIDDENLGENVVAQVFQAGFMLGDKVVRHAVVQVAN